ncbi:MAG: hypothetical protein HYU63_07620 [Armatimonadetes bacterium]|nr:hypothetical protein [Armatimonadota bacterium]
MKKLKIPLSQEILIEPAFKDWEKEALYNRKKSFPDPFLNELKKKCRREILNLLSIKKENQLIFMTGHQPEFFHPGVWMKILLINQAVKIFRGIGINLWVDSSYPKNFIEAPFYQEKIKKKKITLFNLPSKKPYFLNPPPSKEEWMRLKEEIIQSLSTLKDPNPLANFKNFSFGVEEILKNSKNLGEFINTLRRNFENEALYCELPLSLICRGAPFLAYFSYILKDFKNFHFHYNKALEVYRKNHKIRSLVNPFPNLKIENNLLETPFWAITPQGKKENIFLDLENFNILIKDEKILNFKENAIGEMIKEIKKIKLLIFPKALTLTLFFRLFFCDFFLHGIGGGKYEEVNQEIILNYFKITPPNFGIASLSLNLLNQKEKIKIEEITGPNQKNPNHALPLAEIIKKLEKTLYEIKHNPQRLIKKADRETLKLIQEKLNLINQIKLKNKNKLYLTLKIKKVNQILEKKLKSLSIRLQNQIKILKEKEAERKIAHFREYPFCFFKVSQINKIINKEINKIKL